MFSGFYLAFVLLLVALIFRAVAIEFRSKQPMRWWRQMWDVGFCVGSIAVEPADRRGAWATSRGASRWTSDGEFAGTFLEPAEPYPLLLGVTTVALFMMHGAIYG